MYIESGIRYGFRVDFSRGAILLRSCTRNHRSAMESREVVTEHIRTEDEWLAHSLQQASGEFM